jgi:hypothetical protein
MYVRGSRLPRRYGLHTLHGEELLHAELRILRDEEPLLVRVRKVRPLLDLTELKKRKDLMRLGYGFGSVLDEKAHKRQVTLAGHMIQPRIKRVSLIRLS